MQNKNKIRFSYVAIITVVFAAVIASVLSLTHSAKAVSSSVTNKALMYGMYECYKDGNINNKISLADYDGLNSITNYGNSITLPTNFYNVASVNCGQLIGGDWTSDFNGIASMNGISIPENNSNTAAVSSFLTSMGYHETKADGGKCASYTYQYENSSTTAVLKMCATVDEDGNITSDRVEVSGDSTAFQIESYQHYVQLDCNQVPGYGGCSSHSFTPGSTNFDTFAGEILGDLAENNAEAVCLAWWCPWKLVNKVDIESRGDVLANFEFRDRNEAALKAINYMSGYNGLAALKLSEAERAELLQDYLQNYYKIENYGCNLDNSQQTIAAGAGYTAIETDIFGGGFQTCWIKPTANTGSTVAGYNSQYYFDGTPMSYDDIIEALGGAVDGALEEACKAEKEAFLNEQLEAAKEARKKATNATERREIQEYIDKYSNWSYSGTDANGTIVCKEIESFDGSSSSSPTTKPNLPSSGNNGGTSGSTDTNASTDLDQCYDSAGALGWILCPVLTFVANGVDDIYNNYIQSQFLEVSADTISTGSEAYGSWRVIRNIANILFVVMFLIVLFSQLTGIGISNYGIKKILPRLIVVAVLVNASFFICQFAVDVSNVLGYSLNSLFQRLAPQLSGGGNGSLAIGVAGSALTWVGIFTLAVQTAGTWLIPLLLSVLAGAISVIFGGIILGIRQAGVIVLVVVAPIAIVCYALPNAKSVFDRWFKLFTGLLLVFPMCGALMGGGAFASNIIAGSSDSVLLNIIAMLVRVAPFFAIPGLTKGALTAIGNIGTKVSNFGNKLSRTATGAISKSDAVRRGDAELARIQGNFTAMRGRLLNRALKKDNVNELSDRRNAKIARQYAKYNKLRSEEATAFPYAMRPGTREYEAAQKAAHQNRIDTLAKNISLENTDIATDNAALQQRHLEAVNALNENDSDENRAAVQAYNDMLIAGGDDGQSRLADNMSQIALDGKTAGGSFAAQHLIRSHTKSIKPDNRDFYKQLQDMSNAATFSNVATSGMQRNSDGHFSSSNYIKGSISGYDRASIAKIQEGSLDRIIAEAKDGRLDADTRLQLERLTREAMTSDTISVQDKIYDKFNKLRENMGFSTISKGAVSTSSDSGTISLQGNNAASSGAVVQTQNDARAAGMAEIQRLRAEGQRDASWRESRNNRQPYDH